METADIDRLHTTELGVGRIDDREVRRGDGSGHTAGSG